jgi:hypothetical protein
LVEAEICTEPTRKRGRRGQHFDTEVERLAPYLAAARQAGQKSEEAMIDYQTSEVCRRLRENSSRRERCTGF